jgi:serine/threonine-protein kinase RsbW/stage II sporulation protein AB (anti-sigma F factor)
VAHRNSASWRFRAEPQQLGDIREAVTAFAAAHGAQNVEGLRLALSEAITNAILHAYVDASEPGDIEISAVRHPDDGLEICVGDHGRGLRRRPDSPGLGVGMPLIATLAQAVHVESRPGGGTLLTMTFAAA